MPPTPREKYNANARQSTAGSRKKGKQKRSKIIEETEDANSLVHVPKPEEQKEAERKERMKQELITRSDSKWSSKKKKRLEKYIEKKLAKEDRVHILEKLSQTQAQLPSTIHLQSSSTLGTGRPTTHNEYLDKQEDKEVRQALSGTSGKRKREVFTVTEADDDGDTDSDIDNTPSSKDPPSIQSPKPIGSALHREADGSIVIPKVRLKHKQSAFSGWKINVSKPSDENNSDSSFDSSESDNDSTVGFENDTTKTEKAKYGQQDECDDSSEDSENEASEKGKEEEEESHPTRKRFGFKDWAMKQIHIAKGHDPIPFETPSSQVYVDNQQIPTNEPPKKKRKVEMRGPLGEELLLPETNFAKHLLATSTRVSRKPVLVDRPEDVVEARLLLPIVTEEQPIMEAIMMNPVVVICGETGSGKTTQVPQFLFEAGFGSPDSDNPGLIGITQPRRVAAMSMATRVSHELSLSAARVSYQIRYDATVSPSTSIKFMTDGVLLRELATDFLLTKYSVIIIDEAHERSINTDILIGVLSRVVKLRETLWIQGKDNTKPLRLIIMSATLRVSDFAENPTLFPSPPPVINVAARQHPVTVHFNRRTNGDYITEAVKKATKIHTRLPPGGILIFLTGQNEIIAACKKLNAKFGPKNSKSRTKLDETSQNSNVQVNTAQADVEVEEIDLGIEEQHELAGDVDAAVDEEDAEALDTDMDDDDLEEQLGLSVGSTDAPMHVVPLYSLLASEKQMQVFQPPPSGSRLVVVATNVAETSLTIPGIRYVIDCGRAKERHYDLSNGVQAFRVNWISKASAAQRAGRAGRTGPGHCYRLFSSALYQHYFDEFSKPEILRMPIEGVVLQMKSMNIDTVVNFPFPTPPDRMAIQKAENIIKNLGALSSNGQITELGKTMSLFPLSPRYSRMLVNGNQRGCLPYVIAVVSALSVGDPFLHDEGLEDEDEENNSEEDLSHLTSTAIREKEARKHRRKAFFASQHRHSLLGGGSSDILKILSVVGAYEYEGGGHKFCGEHFVRLKAMEEIHKLRAQISSLMYTNFPEINAGFEPKLSPPNDLQLKVIRQLLTSAFIDQVAVRKDRVQQSSGAQYASAKGVPYRAINVDEDVFIHPSSLLSQKQPPDFLIFTDIVRTSRVWIKGVTIVNASWLSSLGKSTMCTFSKPVRNNVGDMMTIPHFGPERWELPAVKAAL